jgi:hypothetical protein
VEGLRASAFFGTGLASQLMTMGRLLWVICGVSMSGCERVRILLVFYFMVGCHLTILTKGYYARCHAKWFQTDGEFKGNTIGWEFGY